MPQGATLGSEPTLGKGDPNKSYSYAVTISLTTGGFIVAGLSEILGQTKERIKGDIKGEINRVKDTIKGAKQDAINTVVNAGRGAVSSVVRGGIDGILGAASDLIHGNPQAALDTILQTPGQILNGIDKSIRSIPLADRLLDSIGFGRGGISLSSPSVDAMSSFSSNAGITEGNSLAGALSRSDPLLNFNWYCILPQITETVYGSVGLPWFYVEEAHIPFRTYQTRSIYREGRTKQYVSKYGVDNMTLTMYLDNSAKTWNYLKAWNAAIIDPFARTNATLQGGRFNPAYKYKKDVKIMVIDNKKQIVIQLLMSECIPISIETFSLGSNSSDRIMARVTFAVGDMFMDPNPAVSHSSITGVFPDLSAKKEEGSAVEVFPIADDTITMSEEISTTDSITVRPL